MRVSVGLIQNQVGYEPAENLDRTIERIHRATELGAQIVCLEELFLSRYFCQTECNEHFDLAEPIPGPTSEVLSALAKELGVVLIPAQEYTDFSETCVPSAIS